MSDLTNKFWDLCSEVDEALQGVGDVQPALRNVLELVVSAPHASNELMLCFIELLNGRGPWEVAYYCMRRLKWLEVYKAASEMFVESADFRVKTVMGHIRAAYDLHQEETDYLY